MEIIGLAFTFLAALWARKQDIFSYIDDPNSRNELVSGALIPELRFRRVSRGLSTFLNRLLQHGFRFFFAMFMLSLLYVSMSFTIAASLSEVTLPIFGNEYDVLSAQIALLMFGASMPLVYVVGSTHNRQLPSKLTNHKNSASTQEKIENLNGQKRATQYFLFCSLLFACATHFAFRSEILSLYAALSSILASMKHQYLKPFFLLRDKRGAAFLGANLGTLGLLLIAYSFASAEMSEEEYFFICIISFVSGALASSALSTCEIKEDKSYNDFWRFVSGHGVYRGIVSSMGRPSLFVGLHCIKTPGPFSLALAIILVNVAFSRAIVPEPIVSAGSIMLACILFFTGATTLAGAGLFSFGAIMLVGIFLLTNPSNIFSLWAAPFFLWILLPISNAAIDFLRWHVARRNLTSYTLGTRFSGLRLIYFDMLFGIVGIFAYAFLAFFILSFFELTGEGLGYTVAFDVKEILDSLREDFVANGIWLLCMAATIMLPTVLQFGLFLYSGLIFLIPKEYLRDLSENINNCSTTYQKDVLAWKISALDVMARLVFSAIFLVAVSAVISQALPLGQIIIMQLIEASVSYGSQAASWVLAAL